MDWSDTVPKRIHDQSSLPNGCKHFDSLPDSAHVRVPVVAALRGCSTATVWRHIQQGLVPKPHKLGPNLTAFNVGELRRAQAALSSVA